MFDILALSYARKYRSDHILSKAGLPARRAVQDALLNLFTDIKVVLTSAHVVGELQGLQTSRLGLRENDFKNFWAHTLDHLASKRLDERLIRLLSMPRDVLSIVGPTDTGLIDLALSTRCPLLTKDGTLKHLAEHRGVVCHLLKYLIGDDSDVR